MSAILQALRLVKDYGCMRAVNGVDLSVERGTCVGLLGPNGAGKSTTLEMLIGVTAPTSGTVLYQGGVLGSAFRAEAGIMFQDTALPDYITVEETLRLYADLYGGGDSRGAAERCGIAHCLRRSCRLLSGGERQRVLLAIALINQPRILFLDEPTTGLDPRRRRDFWALLEDIKREGRAIVLSTHYMEEALTLCDTIAIMHNGRVVASGAPERLIARYVDAAILRLPAADCGGGSAIEGAVCTSDNRLEIVTADIEQTITHLLGRGASLKNLEIERAGLEDLFLSLTGSAVS